LKSFFELATTNTFFGQDGTIKKENYIYLAALDK